MTGSREDGVVLLVVLVLLLLTTIVGFSVMETSTLEAKMAAARQGREVSFQAAESAIYQTKDDQLALGDALLASPEGAPADPSAVAWPRAHYSFPGDTDLRATVEVRYVSEIPAFGNDIVIANPGLRSLHFELRSEVQRADSRFDSLHVQGIKRFAPRLR